VIVDHRPHFAYLLQLLPQSIGLVAAGDEIGGGNRISEEQIKSYLDRTLGQAPRPAWGMPYGWNAYLAELFSWASGKTISAEQAKTVAKREPGRSWEALEGEMEALGRYFTANYNNVMRCWWLTIRYHGACRRAPAVLAPSSDARGSE
jgi:hypothetical protein